MARAAFEIWGEIALRGAERIEGKLKSIGKTAKEVGGKMKDLGDSLTTKVTAPLAVLGAGAIASAIQIDSAAGSMQAQLGLTAQEAEKLNGQAKDLWSQGFGTDMADVTNKVAAVTRSLGDLNDADLKTVIGGLDVLETQFGASTQESMRAVDILMKNFGMSATEAMDYITVGFQNNLDYSGEFLDTLSEYSTYFSEMGFSGQEFFQTLQAGAEGGAFQLDKVGDAMKEFTLRSKDGSKTSTEAFQQIGLSADEMTAAFNKGGEDGRKAFVKVVEGLQAIEDPTARNAASVALFGTQYEDLGEAAFTSLIKAGKGFDDVEGASQKASEAMRANFGTELTTTMRGVQDALLPLGMILIDLAQRALPYVTAAIQSLVNWFTGLSTQGQTTTVVFGLIGAAIGPLLGVLGFLVTAFGNILIGSSKIVTELKKWGPAFKWIATTVQKIGPFLTQLWNWISKLRIVFTIFRAALLALSGPVGIVIAVIVGLIAIGVLLYKNWDTVKQYASTAWAAIWGFLKKYGLLLLGPIGQIIAMGIKLYQNWDTIKSKISAAASAILTTVTTKFNQLKSAMSKPVEAARDLIGTAVGKIKSFFSGLKLSIPKISIPSLPKLKITGKLSLSPPSVPRISWNAKGGVFDGAQLIGIGEAGPEAVLPLSGARKMAPFARALAAEMPGFGGGSFAVTVPVYLNGREIARAAAPAMDQELETLRRRAARSRGVNP